MSTPGRRCQQTPRSQWPAILADVLELHADGNTLHEIVAADPSLPQRGTISRWAEELGGGWVDRYRRAREDCWDAIAEGTIAIADAATTAEEAQIAKVRIDARKWVLGKVAPRYADTPSLVINAAAIQVVAPQAISSGNSNQFLEIGTGDTIDIDPEP